MGEIGAFGNAFRWVAYTYLSCHPSEERKGPWEWMGSVGLVWQNSTYDDLNSSLTQRNHQPELIQPSAAFNLVNSD